MAKARSKTASGSKTALKTTKPVSVSADPIPTPALVSPPPAVKPAAKPAVAAAPKAARRAVTKEEIALRAFQIWEAKGRPMGKDLENWQQAERELGVTG